MEAKTMAPIFMAGADVGALEEKYVLDALHNGWYENKYHYVETLEKKFASYHDREFALMTPNCTSALHLLLAAIGVGPGDEVIVPDCTWIASVVGAHHLGAKLIFADIDEKNWCLSPESVEKNLSSKTKAVLAVDLFGNMANWDELNNLSKKHGFYLIEDAAEALGGSYKGRKAGKFGVGSTFSFHNTKTITTGEGGMLLVDDKDIFRRAVLLRDLGRGPNTKPYFNEMIAYKFMPFNMQAALGLAQFERLDELLEKKRHHLHLYKELLSTVELTINEESEDVVNGAWITAIVLDDKYNLSKTTLIDEADKLGVPLRPFFYPLSSIPAFNLEDEYRGRNKSAYDIASRGVNLPGAYNLSDEQIQFIANGICEVVKKFS